MASMAMDPEVERHRRNWIGFTRFLQWMTASVIVVLVLMALFLL